MRTITENIYTFNELQETAKEVAVKHYQDNIVLTWQDEIINSFKAIATACNCDVDWYSYDGIEYKVSLNPVDLDEGISGVRAISYIYNNFIEPNIKFKYRKHMGSIPVYSTIFKDDYTCFTGYCSDYVLIEAYKEFLNDFRKTPALNIRDFLDILESNMSKEWSNENECQYSDMDYITEYFDANDYEFYSNGNAWRELQ